MGAISIAFDMTITGALALPWLLIAIHLFFPEAIEQVPVVLRWLRRVNQPAAVAVLLFASAYSLGTAISRMAYDFFNDNDLHISDYDVDLQLKQESVSLLRIGMTEDRILASVYCESRDMVGEKQQSSALEGQISNFKSHGFVCWQALRWHVRLPLGQGNEDHHKECAEQVQESKDAGKEHKDATKDQDRDQECEDRLLVADAANVFGLQESAVLLRGADNTERPRQLHDQVMVLRGAAFDGMIALSLCLFAWGATVRIEKPRSLLRWILWLVPFAYLFPALIALVHHFRRPPGISDPPYMEFTLILLGVAGACLVWMKPKKSVSDKPAGNGHKKKSAMLAALSEALPGVQQEAAAGQNQATAGKKLDAQQKTRSRTRHRVCTRWAAGTLVCALLTSAAILGWWSTEVLYAQQIIYSSNAPASAK
jgi:hypothetical protein